MTLTTSPLGDRLGLPADLDELLGLVDPADRHARADTVVTDVAGALHGQQSPLPAVWPLVDALAQTDWGPGNPLTWVSQLPVVEGQALEKGPLVGTKVGISASAGTSTTRGAWTDVSRQAAAAPNVRDAIVGLLEAAVCGDVDRAVATRLAGAGGGGGTAVGALNDMILWPGPRLIVIGAANAGSAVELARYADLSNGAIRVIVDPYITQSFIVATAGVALGVRGPERLIADQPAFLGIDVAVMASFAVEIGPGAVRAITLTPTGWDTAIWGQETFG